MSVVDISVIVTTKNEEENIESCLGSVKQQSYPCGKIEIIVVDNDSIDRTKEIARKYTDKVYNYGPERSAQRNFGVKAANGKYILYLDADMVLSENVIKECVNKCENEDNIALYIPERIIGEGFWVRVRDFERSFYNATCIDCVRFVRKDKFLEIGGFDETLTGPEDWDFDRRTKKVGKVNIINSSIYHNEEELNLKRYLRKKSYYSKSFDKYIEKWGKSDEMIKKQLGMWYRLFGVFIEDRKWKKLLRHPMLTSGMYFLRFLVGLSFVKNKLKFKRYNENKLIVTGHITEIYGPVQALENHLKKKKAEFSFITHPLINCSIKNSYFKLYKKGRLKKQKILQRKILPSYLLDITYNLWITIRKVKNVNLFIGIDNLNAICGIILKKLGYVRKVIYYVIDYTPRRFQNKIMNYLYHAVDKYCVKNCDYIWNISERIANIRERQGVRSDKNLVVSVGIELDKIPNIDNFKNRRKILVFVSHLDKSKGVQLAIEFLEEVIKKYSDVMLEIIGTGPYEDRLKDLAKGKKLERHIRFLGAMSHERLLQYLPTCGVALATYLDAPNSITYYADPTKPKEYLACGLPVIITKVPWIAEEVERKKMGIVINYDKEELIDAVVKLLTDDKFYSECRKNAIEFTSNLSWDKIYDEAFRKIGYETT